GLRPGASLGRPTKVVAVAKVDIHAAGTDAELRRSPLAHSLDTQAKRHAAARAKTDVPRHTMFKVIGDPAKVFADVTLPAGTSVAVIVPNEAAERTLRRSRGFRRFTDEWREWQEEFGAALPRTQNPGAAEPGPNPVIDKQAFEPH